MEEKIIKILELVQTKDDGTVEFSEESKKLIHEVAEKCRILPIYQQNKEKVNTYKDGMTAKQVYIDMCFKIVNAPTQIHMMMAPKLILQTKWREKQRYFAMFARNVDTMMGT